MTPSEREEIEKVAEYIIYSAESIEGPLDFRTKAYLKMEILAQVTKARKEALEEAAKIAESFPGYVGFMDMIHAEENIKRHKRIAKRIRNKLEKE